MRNCSITYKGESEDIEYLKEPLHHILNSSLFNKILSFKAFMVVFWLFFQTTPVIAGGWPQGKGSYFLKLSEWWIESDQHFDDLGNIIDNTHEFGYFATTFYGEYGFSNRLTGIINIPFLNYTYAIPSSRTGKISSVSTGDVDISLQYALTHNKPVAISLKALFGLPLGEKRGELSGGLQTGDGEFNQAIILDGGTGFTLFKSNGWLNIYSGYNNRTANFCDEILFGLESGINLSQNMVMVIIRLNGIKSVGQCFSQTNAQSLFSNRREYLSLSPELAYRFNDSWGITLGMGTALSGKNIFANTTFTVGIFNQKKKYEEKK